MNSMSVEKKQEINENGISELMSGIWFSDQNQHQRRDITFSNVQML